MTASEIEVWRASYRDASDALEAVRYEEVRALTDDAVREQLRNFSTPGEPWRFRPDWSGLVEQQAIFHGLPLD